MTHPTPEDTEGESPKTSADDSPVQHIRPRVVDDCDYCQSFGGSLMMPPHYASESCQSGKRNHCTCGICF